MAIRVIQKGEVKCDGCGTVLARIEASKQVFEVLIEEAQYVKVYCMCTSKVDPNIQVYDSHSNIKLV